MNHVFVLLASFLLRLSSPLGPAHRPAAGAGGETAAPTVDSLAAATARRHAAYQADVLHLRQGQALRLRGAAAARQRELHAAETGAGGAPAAQAAEVRYQLRLTQLLSANQYSTLLALNAAPDSLTHRRSPRQTTRHWARLTARPGGGLPTLLADASTPTLTPATR